MSDENRVTFRVPDMTCGHCVGTIRASLEEHMPGSVININLDEHLVSIVGDRATAEAAIRDAGYTPDAVN